MPDILTPDLLPGYAGKVVQKRLVDMGDGTFAELTVATLAASGNSIGTVDLGSLGGAATAANQSIGNAALTLMAAPFAAAISIPLIGQATAGSGVSLTSPPASVVNGAGTASSPWLLGPFQPQLTRDIWLTLNGTGASGSAQLLRSNDRGTTRLSVTQAGAAIGAFSFANVTGAIVNEKLVNETDASASYYVSIVLTAGALAIRLSQ